MKNGRRCIFGSVQVDVGKNSSNDSKHAGAALGIYIGIPHRQQTKILRLWLDHEIDAKQCVTLMVVSHFVNLTVWKHRMSLSTQISGSEKRGWKPYMVFCNERCGGTLVVRHDQWATYMPSQACRFLLYNMVSWLTGIWAFAEVRFLTSNPSALLPQAMP